MSLIECPECSGTWFSQELLFQLPDDVIDDDGGSAQVGQRHIYRCVRCGAVPDLSRYGQGYIGAPTAARP